MDAAQALTELVELSSQVRRAVVVGGDGSILGSTPADAEPAARLAAAASDALAAASGLRAAGSEATRVEVELAEGALFVLAEGGRTIAAVTGPEPTSGLVVYDLRTCLDRIEEAPKPRRRRAAKPAAEEAGT
jgi:predicted regulator of Ras-like GTPase activity (Roadblock/LC7/MglB family)